MMSEITARISRIWINPPATWNTLRPNSQATNKITNRIVKILMNAPCGVSSTTYKNHNVNALNWSEQSGSLQELVYAALLGPLRLPPPARPRGCSPCYQCHIAAGEQVPALVMRSMVDSVEATGILGMIGIVTPDWSQPARRLCAN